MSDEALKKYPQEKFKRLTGVKLQTFAKMVEILRESEKQKKSLVGKPNKLAMEDHLLMPLGYLVESEILYIYLLIVSVQPMAST